MRTAILTLRIAGSVMWLVLAGGVAFAGQTLPRGLVAFMAFLLAVDSLADYAEALAP